MGSWSVAIMGGDTPLDVQCEFEDLFGAETPNEFDKNPAPYRVPSAEELITLIRDSEWQEGVRNMVIGYLAIERGSTFNDDLRELVITGIDEEVEGIEDWDNPEARRTVLEEFRSIVIAYPNEGKAVEMPHQPGLFETILSS